MEIKNIFKALTICAAFAAAPNVSAQQTGDSPYSSYLFAFFSNNSPNGEQIRYALSDNGFDYKSLNNGRPVVSSDTIALKKSIRDPHIIRAEDGKTFYMAKQRRSHPHEINGLAPLATYSY